jgi:methionine aminopeptidase
MKTETMTTQTHRVDHELIQAAALSQDSLSGRQPHHGGRRSRPRRPHHHRDERLPLHGRALCRAGCRRGRGFLLRHGLALAIEPVLMAGGRNDYRTDPDGWTLRTIDGSRAAHIEHTVAITEDGPRILTLP